MDAATQFRTTRRSKDALRLTPSLPAEATTRGGPRLVVSLSRQSTRTREHEASTEHRESQDGDAIRRSFEMDPARPVTIGQEPRIRHLYRGENRRAWKNLGGFSMATRPADIPKQIRLWLSDEAWTAREITNPQTSWLFEATGTRDWLCFARSARVEQARSSYDTRAHPD